MAFRGRTFTYFFSAVSLAVALMFSVPAAKADGSQDQKRFYINIDAGGALFNPNAKIYVAGNRVPGSVSIQDNAALLFNIGYYVMPKLSVDLLLGATPPHATIHGIKEASFFGPVASANYAPPVLSLLYHQDLSQKLSIYFGPGVNYIIFLSKHSINAQNFKVADHWGAAVTVGFNYKMNDTWGLNLAVTQVFLSTNVKGDYPTPYGVLPVKAKVRVNPTVVQGGVTFHF